ncbi:hypothetical protein [Cereibacter sphaeroides]|uniref:hypothetical protein n=1 Tax=Cereibacter sphaeroides TaxID=1063 RepID=UPI0015F90716|nr:hypothetical protein [Cereibacter sphaeroides]
MADGLVWHCHHCGHSGGGKFEGWTPEPPKRGSDRFANTAGRSFGGKRDFTAKRRFS